MGAEHLPCPHGKSIGAMELAGLDLSGQLAHLSQNFVNAHFAQHNQAVLFAQHLVHLRDMSGDGPVQNDAGNSQSFLRILGHAGNGADHLQDGLVQASRESTGIGNSHGALFTAGKLHELPGQVLVGAGFVDAQRRGGTHRAAGGHGLG